MLWASTSLAVLQAGAALAVLQAEAAKQFSSFCSARLQLASPQGSETGSQQGSGGEAAAVPVSTHRTIGFCKAYKCYFCQSAVFSFAVKCAATMCSHSAVCSHSVKCDAKVRCR